MKNVSIYFFAIALTLSSVPFAGSCQSYNSSLVEVASVEWGSDKFISMTISREGQRIKAKYFAGKDGGFSVYERYQKWGAGRNIILATSGTYMDECDPRLNPKPVGLTIDNGVTVNRTFKPDFGGIVIVYATGGIVASKLKDGDLQMKCNNQNQNFDIKNTWQRNSFISCAESMDATTFQAHLLVWKNRLNVFHAPSCSSCQNERERRFLAVGKDGSGTVKHAVVHLPSNVTLFEGTKKVLEFLQDFVEMEEVIFMINLDTGCQDVLELRDENGRIRSDISGSQPITQAANLLVYYYD